MAVLASTVACLRPPISSSCPCVTGVEAAPKLAKQIIDKGRELEDEEDVG
jgi:hypothetical protein